MVNTDTAFSGAIAQFYDRHFGPPLFGPYAEDIAARLASLSSGALLEVAAGTGIVTSVLAQSLPAAVAIAATDLNQPMLDFAATKAGLDRVIWQQADAMDLPFPDASFDTAVVTFALCSVPDEQAALSEITRVLAPGGRLLFLEHVRSADPRVAAKQDKVPFPYPLIGCHPNRDTLAEIKASPLAVESVREGELPKAPQIERPMIAGTARRPTNA